jgi:hypothetical protein
MNQSTIQKNKMRLGRAAATTTKKKKVKFEEV